MLSALVLFSCVAHTDVRNEKVMLANRLFEAFNKHDWKAMASLYSDSAKFLDPSFGKDFISQSRAQTIAKYTELEKMFPNIQDHLIGIYSSGDKVIAEFISTGTSDQGYALKLPIVTVLTLRDGQIISDATYYDLENP